MSLQFHAEDENIAPIYDTTEVNLDGQPKLGSDTFGLREYDSERVVPVGRGLDFDFQQYVNGWDQVYIQGTMPLANIGDTSWMHPDTFDSLDSGLSGSILSNTSTTRDFDATESTIIVPQRAETSSGSPKNEGEMGEMFYSNLSPFSAVEVLPHPGSSHVLANTIGNPDAFTSCCSSSVTQLCKRPAVTASLEEDGDGLISKKSAIRILLHHYILNPSDGIIECIAKDFCVSTEYVANLCSKKPIPPKSDLFSVEESLRCDQSLPKWQNLQALSVVQRCRSIDQVETDQSLLLTSHEKEAQSDSRALQVAKKQSKRLFCAQCGDGITFTRKYDLKRHKLSHATRRIHCHYVGCHWRGYRMDKLQSHIRSKHKNRINGLDMPRNTRQEPEDDEDDRIRSIKGFFSGSKSMSVSSNMAASTSMRFSGCTKCSADGKSDALTNMETPHSYSQMNNANKYAKAFPRARIIRKLGKGGFGHVYEVSASELHSLSLGSFACKIIQVHKKDNFQVMERARNEIKILQALDHPNIISFIGAFISVENVIINTGPVAHYNLKEFLNQQPCNLSSIQKCELWAGVHGLASALSYIHGHSEGEIVHGDIKPENILVFQDANHRTQRRLLLADFGSARLSTSTASTWPSKQAITPRYRAPEHVCGDRQVVSSSDIWSFGCTMVEIFTFLHDQNMADFGDFRNRSRGPKQHWSYQESLPTVRIWLKKLLRESNDSSDCTTYHSYTDLIIRMLSREPNERPSATEIVAELELTQNLYGNVDVKFSGIKNKIKLQSLDVWQGTSFQVHKVESLRIRPDEFSSLILTREIFATGDTIALKSLSESQFKIIGIYTGIERGTINFGPASQYLKKEQAPDHGTVRLRRAESLHHSRIDAITESQRITFIGRHATCTFEDDPTVAQRLRDTTRKRSHNSDTCTGCFAKRLAIENADGQPVPILEMKCFRGALRQYADIFFPPFLFSHLDDAVLNNFIRESHIHFTQVDIKIELYSGPSYPPLKLVVNEYIQSNSRLLEFGHVSNCHSTSHTSMRKSSTPPVGILSTGDSVIKDTCSRYISVIVQNMQSSQGCLSEATSTMSRRVLRAIYCFQISGEPTPEVTTLLEKAWKLYAILHFINSPIVFTEDSAKKVITSLQGSKMPPYTKGPTLASTLLNLQIKQAMWKLFKPTVIEVLDGLDQHLRKKHNRPSWSASFCIILILTMCIEEVQLAVDSFILASIRRSSSNHSIQPNAIACKNEDALAHVTTMFRGTYRIHKLGIGHKSLDKIIINEKGRITKGESRLVQDIHDIMRDHANEIADGSRSSTFVTRREDLQKDLIGQHKNLREQNSGRLLAKYVGRLVG